MSHQRLKIILPILLLLVVLGLTPAAQAQAPTGLVVTYPAVEDKGDSLGLNVFFTAVDPTGRPVSDLNVESASIELLGAGVEPVPATVDRPNTPFYVVLLLDASGSMANVMGEVREAAKEAIDSAPPAANFAVVQFSDDFRPVTEFINDIDRVKSAIDRVQSIPGGPTCMYDSAYDAIDLLDRQISSPVERRAVILFTDGKDERADQAGPCSFYNYNDVTSRARPLNEPNTPIHTIGLCSDAACSNINGTELRNMAIDTVAFSATGQRGDLRELFREIMDGLNSQWVARANVYARKGENQAVLSVKLRDIDTPLTTTFNFFSEKDYAPPLAPVTTQITGVTYDRPNDVYNLAISVTSPELVRQVIVQVWDSKSGTQVLPDQIFENPGPTITFERPTDGFEAGREYTFRVLALNRQDALIETEDGKTVLAEQPVVYEPIQAVAVDFAIESVNASYSEGQLLIDLNINGNPELNTYDGFVIDAETGQRIFNFGPEVFDGRQIQQPLPEAIAGLEAPNKFNVTVYLTTKQDQRVGSAPYEFTAVPPPPPGLLTRIGVALVSIPVLLFSVVLILLSVVMWVVFRSRQKNEPELRAPKRPSKDLARPPTDQTILPGQRYGAMAIPTPSARLKLTVTAPGGQPQSVELSQFPCVLGRDPQGYPLAISTVSDKPFLNVPHPGVSRRHAEITERGGTFFIADLESRNGTYINTTRLQPNRPTSIDSSMTIYLGRQTYLTAEKV
ncbi:MAG: hypothetical protein Kow0031_29750 [Anaerolineae bacterium]